MTSQGTDMCERTNTSRHSFRRGEEGAVAVTVAITLLLLIGFAALAIDTGLGYATRRVEQNGADNAALAAAWEVCNPSVTFGGDAEAAAKATASANGFDDTVADITVTVTPISSDRFEVVISASDDTTFGRASPGAGSITVVSRAVAKCEVEPFLGGYAIFAGADQSCGGGVELDLSGASKIINGGIHSNGDIKNSGANTTINGPVTYFGEIVGDDIPGASRLNGPLLDYPLDITIDEFVLQPGVSNRAATAAAAGEYYNAGSNDITNTWMVNNGYATSLGDNAIEIQRSGIYFTRGDITLSKVSAADGVTVTFVAEDGQIHINGEGSDLTAYEPIDGGPNDPGLLMFSSYLEPASGGPTCTGNAILFSLSNVTWNGVLYAPYGQIRFATAEAGPATKTLNGSIFAYTVNVSASNFTITWQDNPAATPVYTVELLE